MLDPSKLDHHFFLFLCIIRILDQSHLWRSPDTYADSAGPSHHNSVVAPSPQLAEGEQGRFADDILVYPGQIRVQEALVTVIESDLCESENAPCGLQKQIIFVGVELRAWQKNTK